MIYSMTGFGSAELSTSGLSVAIEIRSLNNRHLKVSVRGSSPYPMMEAEFEKLLREKIHRGSVLVQIRVQRHKANLHYVLQLPVLQEYLQQLRTFCEEDTALFYHLSGQALSLPGILPEEILATTPESEEWELVTQTLQKALIKLHESRSREGEVMTDKLRQIHHALSNSLRIITDLAPQVVESYRQRLLEKLKQSLQELDVQLDASHVLREVALFADRTDIHEEIVRLEAHLRQFLQMIEAPAETSGRKMEFLIQELTREINTMGSKAGDVRLSTEVYEMKGCLEKIRELVQNIE